MPRLIWSPPALLDVQRLYRFLAEKNPDAAKRAVKTIREVVQIIAVQPVAGRPAEDMEVEYREWLIDFGDSGYIALYHYDGQTVLIVAVRHQKEVGYIELGQISV
jgi:plasmid stabilization system protein ParE